MSSAYNSLAFRIALGDDLVQSPGPFLTSSHPSITGSAPMTGSFYYENGSVSEIYSDAFIINSSSVGYGHSVYSALVNPPNVGNYTEVTSKIRIPSQSLVTGSTLSPYVSIQEPYDPAYTKDLSYLEVAISPQNVINDDIINDLGYFNIDDFIGNPAEAASSSYADLDFLREDYFKKYIRKQNILDTIKLLSYYDNSLFKMIKDFVPAKVRLATGLTIKPHLLERSKYPSIKPQTQRPEFSGSMLTLPYLPNDNQDLVSVTGSSAEGLDIDTSFTQSITTPSGSIVTVQTDQRQTITGEFGGSIINAYSLPNTNVVYEDDDSLLREIKIATNRISSGDAQDGIIPFGTFQTRSYYSGPYDPNNPVPFQIQIHKIPNPGNSEYAVGLSQKGGSRPPASLPLEFINLKGSTTYTLSTWVAYSDGYSGDRSRVFFGSAPASSIGFSAELSGKTGSLVETTVVAGRTWYKYQESIITPPSTDFTQSIDVENDIERNGYMSWLVGYPVENGNENEFVYFTNIQMNEGSRISETIFSPFKVPLTPTYQNVTSSRKSLTHLDLDYSYNSILPVNNDLIIERLGQYTTESIDPQPLSFLNAQVQDSNYTLTRHINPRYLGTKTVSSKLSEYREGDSGYGRLPNIGLAVSKFAYFQKAEVASSGSFFGRTQLDLKYLIDGERNVTELNSDNENLFEVQNLFNNSENLVLSLDDREFPYDNQNLNGSKKIYAGGFRFEPMLVKFFTGSSPTHSSLTQYFPDSVNIPVPNLGTETAPNGTVILGNYNFDQVGISPNGRNAFISGQVRVPVSRTQLGFEAERIDKSLLVFVRGNLTLNFILRVNSEARALLVQKEAQILQNSMFGSYLGVAPSNRDVSYAPDGIKVSITYNFTQKDNIYVEVPAGVNSFLSPLKIGVNNINEALNLDILPSKEQRLFGTIRLPQITSYGFGYTPANFYNNYFNSYNPYYNAGYTSQQVNYSIINAQASQGTPTSLLLNNVKESGLLNKIPIYIAITGSMDSGSTARGNNYFFERNPLVPYQMTASINLTRWHGKFIQTGSLPGASGSHGNEPLYYPKTTFEVSKGDIVRFTNHHESGESNLPISYEREITNVILNEEYSGDIKPSGSTAFAGGSNALGIYTYADTRLVIEFDDETPIPPQACYDYNSSSRTNPQYINEFVIYKKIPDETSIVLDIEKNTPPSGSDDTTSSGFLIPKYISRPLKERAGNVIKNLKGQNLI